MNTMTATADNMTTAEVKELIEAVGIDMALEIVAGDAWGGLNEMNALKSFTNVETGTLSLSRVVAMMETFKEDYFFFLNAAALVRFEKVAEVDKHAHRAPIYRLDGQTIDVNVLTSSQNKTPEFIAVEKTAVTCYPKGAPVIPLETGNNVKLWADGVCVTLEV